MNILYIATLVVGFRDILEGKADSRGLPSFIYPLKKLLEDGNNVEIVLISNYAGKIDIKADWIKNENIVANINNDFATTKGLRRIINKIKSIFEVYGTINKLLKTRKYDFVYCHGTAALLGNFLANKHKVKCAYRVYGVVWLAKIIRDKGLLYAFLKNIKYALIFNFNKEFMLITDDGTNGDYVYEKMCLRKNYPLYFWLNGVDFIDEAKLQDHSCREKYRIYNKYIFHTSRIDRLKRQDKVIDVLHKVHQAGIKIHSYFAGHISDEKYYEELLEYTKQLKLENYVHFLGAIPRDDMENLAHNSIAVILFGDCSNSGNVFFECAMAGSIIITFEEDNLKKFIEDKKNGFFVKNQKEAADIVQSIINNQIDEKRMKDSIRNQTREIMKSWNERVIDEVNLIYENKRREIC